MSERGFPDSLVGKESTCNAGDPGLIPGWGRSAGEGIGYPLQYSWVSYVAQLVKNLPAMWETWVQSLGWVDPLEKGKAYFFFFLLHIFLLHIKKLHFHCVLHIKKLKHREVKLLAQLFSKWPKWDLNLETLASNSRLLISFSESHGFSSSHILMWEIGRASCRERV